MSHTKMDLYTVNDCDFYKLQEAACNLQGFCYRNNVKIVEKSLDILWTFLDKLSEQHLINEDYGADNDNDNEDKKED